MAILREPPKELTDKFGMTGVLWLMDILNRMNERIAKNTAATAGNIAKFASDGDIEDSGKAPPSGDIVGTSDTQTLTAKTLTTPTVDQPTVNQGTINQGTQEQPTINQPTIDTPVIADLTDANHNHQAAAGGGQLDHGLALTGLGDDDHALYPLVDNSRGFTAGFTGTISAPITTITVVNGIITGWT